jgi:hypothetical protein
MFDGMTDKHLNFDLSKTDNTAADVGMVNERNILCKFCNQVILGTGTALKVQHNIHLVKNNLREYEPMNTYWHVNDLTRFRKVMVH